MLSCIGGPARATTNFPTGQASRSLISIHKVSGNVEVIGGRCSCAPFPPACIGEADKSGLLMCEMLLAKMAHPHDVFGVPCGLGGGDRRF